jgi:hypothetical protein
MNRIIEILEFYNFGFYNFATINATGLINNSAKMITKNENAKNKQFKGVSFDVLAVGQKSMVTRMNYKVGDIVPLHSHPNEQSG